MFKIALEKSEAAFIPGESIRGAVHGRISDATKDDALAVRLIWYTSGKGTRDFAVVDERRYGFDQAAQLNFAFEFIAPRRPLSFSGQLISLQWAIEAVSLPSKNSTRADIVITCGSSEICLVSVAEDMKALGVGKPWLQIGNR